MSIQMAETDHVALAAEALKDSYGNLPGYKSSDALKAAGELWRSIERFENHASLDDAIRLMAEYAGQDFFDFLELACGVTRPKNDDEGGFINRTHPQYRKKMIELLFFDATIEVR